MELHAQIAHPADQAAQSVEQRWCEDLGSTQLSMDAVDIRIAKARKGNASFPAQKGIREDSPIRN